MFSYITMLCLGAMVFTLVHSAPTPSLDAATLLKNGQDAQKQNTLFQTIKATDPCTSGDKACISEGVASCINGQWEVSRGRCSSSQQCFALPSVQGPGTLVTCTSERNALSAIEATGASGGIFGTSGSSTSMGDSTTGDNTNDKDNTGSDDCGDDEGDQPLPPSSSISTSQKSEPTTMASNGSDNRVTVTVTLTAQPTTFAPQTRTLSPEEASSVLSSLMAGGATILVSPPSLTTTMASVTATPAVDPSSKMILSQTPSTTILLTAATASASALSSGGYDY